MTRVALICLAFLTAGCASIMHGTSQDVGISSSPTGATIAVDNMPQGMTPVVAKLSRKDNHIVKISMPGYAPAELTLTKSTSGWVWGNIVFGGVIGLAVDAITGGLYNLTPNQLQATLATQHANLAPAHDGIYVVLVPAAGTDWQKVGQLTRATATAVGQ